MKKNRQTEQTTGRALSVFARFSPYLVLMLVPLSLYWIAVTLQISDLTWDIEPLMWLCILGVFAVFLYRGYTGGFRAEDLFTLILLLGFILRIGYMLYTYLYTRQHDSGSVAADSAGHLGYIWTLFTEHRLPDSNRGQFYQAPFYYMASTVSVWLTSLVFPAAANETLAEAAKVVSCFASMATLLVTARIINELGLKRTGRLIALAIAAFHPTFFLMGGRINNDALVTFFTFVIVLYTIRWYREQSVKNTVVLALAFGFGMMTKISCGTMAFFTAPVLLYVWFKSRKTPAFSAIFGKGALFIGICAPLGLWYPIRNLIAFGQPLNYVLYLGESSELYVGNYSLVERFFPTFKNLFDSLYCVPNDEYNIPLYLFRNSVMGEFSYDIADFIPKLLVLVNIVLIAVSLAATIYVLVRGKQLTPLLRFGMPFLWLLQVGSYVIFQLQYPFGCTMDYRYIPMTCVLGALMIGSAVETIYVKDQKAYRFVHVPVVALTVAFCALSAVMYCSIG